MIKNNAALGFRLLSSLILFTFLISTLGVSSVNAAGIRYATASGAGDCSSWAAACSLQAALTGALSGDEIWVTAGVYKPAAVTTDRTATFQLKAGVALYGGFAGTETDRTQRSPTANLTILSGDIDNNDSQTPIITNLSTVAGNTTNSYHVVTGATSAPLDGFTITAGYADGTAPIPSGGGFLSGNPSTLTNVTFSGNTAATGSGGGMSSSSSTLTNVNFIGNTAANSGGGLISGSSTLTNITFSGNTATNGGGFYIACNKCSFTMTNVTFSGNTATNAGGGMYNGCTQLNKATLTAATFSGNTATNTGGGMYNINSAGNSLTIRNSIFWANAASTGSQVIGTLSISNSVVQGGYASGTTIITADPNLGTLGNYGGFTQTIPLNFGSSAINATSSCPTTDQRGVTRGTPTCDIGAYEVAAPTLTSIVPNSGTTGGGTSVVITGTNLTFGTVTFDGTAAACTGDSDTQLTCSSPAHAGGAVDVVVTTPYPDSGVTSSNGFVYEDPTAVELMNFVTFRGGGGAAVSIDWKTVSDVSTIGFNIFRSTSPQGDFEKLKQDLIIVKSPGQLTGSAYDYQDSTAQPGQTYFYRLEAIGTDMQVLYSAELINWPYAVFMSVILSP